MLGRTTCRPANTTTPAMTSLPNVVIGPSSPFLSPKEFRLVPLDAQRAANAVCREILAVNAVFESPKLLILREPNFGPSLLGMRASLSARARAVACETPSAENILGALDAYEKALSQGFVKSLPDGGLNCRLDCRKTLTAPVTGYQTRASVVD